MTFGGLFCLATAKNEILKAEKNRKSEIQKDEEIKNQQEFEKEEQPGRNLLNEGADISGVGVINK